MAAALPAGVSWTQDEDSVEITVLVPELAGRENVRVTTAANSLLVQCNAESKSWRPLLTGMLRHNVVLQSCCWALEKQRKGGQAVVIQLEKIADVNWDALLRASTEGSILEELGRDQVIVDAGASTAESLVCGRCGALVKSSRMEAHMTLWCEALASDDGASVGTSESTGEAEAEGGRNAASHLYWSRNPTIPAGSPGAVLPQKLSDATDDADGELV